MNFKPTDYALVALIFAIICVAAILDMKYGPKPGKPEECTILQRELNAASSKIDRAVKNENWNGAQDAIGYMRGIDKAMQLFCGEGK